MFPDVLKRAMQASPVKAVCAPLERATPASMLAPSGVASISAVNVPVCAETKARFCQAVPDPGAVTVKQGGGPGGPGVGGRAGGLGGGRVELIMVRDEEQAGEADCKQRRRARADSP